MDLSLAVDSSSASVRGTNVASAQKQDHMTTALSPLTEPFVWKEMLQPAQDTILVSFQKYLCGNCLHVSLSTNTVLFDQTGNAPLMFLGIKAFLQTKECGTVELRI